MSRVPPVFTNLGMHFVDAGADVVLVQVEVNVRGLLAVHARRLIKSKRSMANVSSGTVRMTVATPDDREKAQRAHAMAVEAEDHQRVRQENARLHTELTRQRHELVEAGRTVDILIDNVNGLRDQVGRREVLAENDGSGI